MEKIDIEYVLHCVRNSIVLLQQNELLKVEGLLHSAQMSIEQHLSTITQQQLSDSESKDLLPCPFCGAIPIKNRKEAVFQILCTTCLTEKTAFDFETAIQRWNTRTSNIVQQQLSGSPEGSLKCPADTSDNGKRCVKDTARSKHYESSI